MRHPPRRHSHRLRARETPWFHQQESLIGATPPCSGSCHRASIGLSTSGRLTGRSTCFVLDTHSSRIVLTAIHCTTRQSDEYKEVEDLLSEDTKSLLTTRDGVAVLIHWGPEDLDGGVIDPGFFGRNRYTTDLRSRGDKFSMYYIRDEDAEEIVIGSSEEEARKVRYEAELPLSDIYEFNTDPLGLVSKAEELFRRDWGPTSAFGPNEQAEYIGILAREQGFTAMILQWRGSRRVDVFVPLTPTSNSSRANSEMNLNSPYSALSSESAANETASSESPETSCHDCSIYAPVLAAAAAAALATMLVLGHSQQNLDTVASSNRSPHALEVAQQE